MPEYGLHYSFGQQVLAALPEEISIDHHVYDFALTGPDDWFFFIQSHRMRVRGSFMHVNHTRAFLTALAERPELFSYFAGFICHYALDSSCHPYIIVRTGFDRKTKATRQYAGNHMAFEKALDLRMLAWEQRASEKADSPQTGDRLQASKKDPHPFSIHIPKQPLPETIRKPLNEVYKTIFGWDHVYEDLNKAKRYFLFVTRRSEDPHSIVKGLTGLTGNPKLTAFPFSREAYQEEDILNLEHREWFHPNDPSLLSVKSIPDLIEDAKEKAVRIITAAAGGDLSLIENGSYLTGFDLEDPRNFVEETYEILKR